MVWVIRRRNQPSTDKHAAEALVGKYRATPEAF
jgi:hypothetical protein